MGVALDKKSDGRPNQNQDIYNTLKMEPFVFNHLKFHLVYCKLDCRAKQNTYKYNPDAQISVPLIPLGSLYVILTPYLITDLLHFEDKELH